MRRFGRTWRAIAGVAWTTGWLAVWSDAMGPPPGESPVDAPARLPTVLLADDARLPHGLISWPTREGGRIELEADRPYRSPKEREFLGKNLECFVALGGTRLDAYAGHPAGAVVRIGFYKADPAKPMFDDLAEGAEITVKLKGVYFNQPVVVRTGTALQHLKYMPGDLEACGLGGQALDLFNTESLTDTLKGKLKTDNARMAVLDPRLGEVPGTGAKAIDAESGKVRHGSVRVSREADGSVSLEAVIPYELFRHMKDPWQKVSPGFFLEPNHFHVEFEVITESAARSEEDAKAAPGGAGDGSAGKNPG